MENLEMEAITATKVADEDRLNFWLRHVGAEEKKLAFVRYAFCWMQRLCPHYREKHRQLYDYIESHPEAQAIYAAIE